MIILAIVVIALVAGFIANWLVGRGRNYQPWELFVVGIIGSFVGGLIFNLVAGKGFDLDITGLVGSTLGAIVVLAAYGPIRDWWTKRNAPAASTNTIRPRKK
jgi:uncharacterized membrane protein YeaQ/YmgE (transglycosylase-associated protein family)